MFVPEDGVVCPGEQLVRTFPLDLADMLIGRRSDVRDIHPEIPINDDTAISHRHAKLLRQADGSYLALDLGSNNGTKLNDKDLTPGVRVPLTNGDELRLGRWTLIRIKAQQVS
jgi:pSer/pThr/pTyr-binding forkhead associated (FHA) protein